LNKEKEDVRAVDDVVLGLHGTVAVLLENRLRGWVHSEGECKDISGLCV
jgi:hypothetical protein